jgi:hypothetical protein
MNPRRISNLAADTIVVFDSPLLLVFKRFRDTEPGALATLGNASMQGVGTELGTADNGLLGIRTASELSRVCPALVPGL